MPDPIQNRVTQTEPAPHDIESLNHSRALARQQQNTRPQKIYDRLEHSPEVISHW